jgi:hypothetical protein
MDHRFNRRGIGHSRNRAVGRGADQKKRKPDECRKTQIPKRRVNYWGKRELDYSAPSTDLQDQHQPTGEEEWIVNNTKVMHRGNQTLQITRSKALASLPINTLAAL